MAEIKETGPLSRTGMGKKYDRAPLKQRIQEYLIAHPEATNGEVAKRFEVAPATVSKARMHAIKNGYVGPSYFDRRSEAGLTVSEAGWRTGTDLEETIRKVVQEAKPGETQLTTEESLLMLSQLARAAKRDGANKLAIEANVAFHRLKSQSKEAKLGPAPPLTFDEKVERCSRVLEAAGHRAAKAAWQVAFPEKEAEIGLPYAFPTTGDPHNGQNSPEIEAP